MRWRVKKLFTEGGLGEWGNRPNYILEVQFQYLLGYPSILLGYPSNNHTLCLLLVIYVLLPSIYSFSTLQPLSWKVTFSGTQKFIQPTVFNLQSSDWLRCEEETGAYYSVCWLTSKLVSFFILILKIAYFGTKNFAIFKKFHKIYFWIFVIQKIDTIICIYVLYAMITSNLCYL